MRAAGVASARATVQVIMWRLYKYKETDKVLSETLCYSIIYLVYKRLGPGSKLNQAIKAFWGADHGIKVISELLKMKNAIWPLLSAWPLEIKW